MLHKSLEVALDELRVEVHGSGHTVKDLLMSNKFRTAAVWIWAASCEPSIELQTCIPHEHHSNRGHWEIQSDAEECSFKKLFGRKHLTAQYWAMAYEEYIMKANFMGSVHGPSQFPYELRTGKHPDLIKLPKIPFGPAAMTHIPLDQQIV